MIEVTRGDREIDGTAVDLATLERWASLTGGRVIDPTREEGWVSAGTPAGVTSIRQHPYDLWHNFSLMLLLSLLLALDWSYRLFRGFV